MATGSSFFIAPEDQVGDLVWWTPPEGRNGNGSDGNGKDGKSWKKHTARGMVLSYSLYPGMVCVDHEGSQADYSYDPTDRMIFPVSLPHIFKPRGKLYLADEADEAEREWRLAQAFADGTLFDQQLRARILEVFDEEPDQWLSHEAVGLKCGFSGTTMVSPVKKSLKILKMRGWLQEDEHSVPLYAFTEDRGGPPVKSDEERAAQVERAVRAARKAGKPATRQMRRDAWND